MKTSLPIIKNLPYSLMRVLFTPRLLLICMVPYFIGLLAFASSIPITLSFRDEIATYVFSAPDTWYSTLFEWLLIPIAFLVSGIFAFLAIMAFAGWFLEFLIQDAFRLREFHFREDPKLRELPAAIMKGILDDGKRLAVLVPITLLTLISSLFPLLSIIPLILTSFVLGFDVFDGCLASAGYRFSERWRVIKAHLLSIIVLGAGFTLILLLPVANVLLLPIIYHASALTLSDWNIDDPNTLP